MKRYEKEIVELLERMDQFIPDESRRKRGVLRFVRRISQAVPRPNLSPTSLIVASIGLAFLGFFLGQFFRPAAPVASIASVILLIGAIVLHAVQRRKRSERRWRGRVVDIERYRPGFSSNLSYRWRKIWRYFWQRRG